MKVTHSNIVLKIAYQAGNKLTAKHIVEEAMTEAFVRKCNNCNKVFVKEDGCNRIKCGCGNLQCYVCEMNVVDSAHFTPPGSCPLYGEMHLNEQVAVAQERTVRELLNNRAELEDDDIRVDKEMSVNITMDLEAPRPPVVELQLVPAPNLFLPWGNLRIQNELRHVHNPRVHICLQCDKGFRTAGALSQHETAKKHRTITCRGCQKSFRSQNALSQHRRAKHGYYG